MELEKDKQQKTLWHPAFVEAIQATLIDYRDALDYKPELPLNAEPLCRL